MNFVIVEVHLIHSFSNAFKYTSQSFPGVFLTDAQLSKMIIFAISKYLCAQIYIRLHQIQEIQ